jgi:hypothetical protein
MITINIDKLINNSNISPNNFSKSLSNDVDCNTNVKHFNYSDISVLPINGVICIPIFLEQSNQDFGCYVNIQSGDTIEIEPYQISGETDSKMSDVQNYLGGNVIGVNYTEIPNFTGIISIEGDKITYVINGKYNINGYVNGSGVKYITNILNGYTTFYCTINTVKYNNTQFKYENTIGEISPPNVFNNALIDRGDIISPNQLLYKLMELKTNEDFTNTNIYKIYKQ